MDELQEDIALPWLETKKPKRFEWKSVLLCLASTILTLLVLEGAFRLFDISPPPIDHVYKPRKDPNVNSLGFRDREYCPEKPEDTFRILCIGDSFTYGWGVKKFETYPKSLEVLIWAHNPGRSVEVWNCGEPGWGTSEEVQLLKEKGIGFEPDAVILGFFLNDATNDSFNPEYHWIMRESRRKTWLDRHSAMFYYFHYHWKLWQMTKRTTEKYLDAFSNKPETRQYWEKCQQALVEAKELSLKHDFKFAVIIFPMVFKLNEDYPFHSIHEKIQNICDKEKIPWLDLFDTLKDYDAESLMVSQLNLHLNGKGNKIASEAIEKFIMNMKWLEADTATEKDSNP